MENLNAQMAHILWDAIRSQEAALAQYVQWVIHEHGWNKMLLKHDDLTQRDVDLVYNNRRKWKLQDFVHLAGKSQIVDLGIRNQAQGIATAKKMAPESFVAASMKMDEDGEARDEFEKLYDSVNVIQTSKKTPNKKKKNKYPKKSLGNKLTAKKLLSQSGKKKPKKFRICIQKYKKYSFSFRILQNKASKYSVVKPKIPKIMKSTRSKKAALAKKKKSQKMIKISKKKSPKVNKNKNKNVMEVDILSGTLSGSHTENKNAKKDKSSKKKKKSKKKKGRKEHPAKKYERYNKKKEYYDSEHEDGYSRRWHQAHQVKGTPEFRGCTKGETVNLLKKTYICARGHKTDKQRAKYYCPLYLSGCKKRYHGFSLLAHVWEHIALGALRGFPFDTIQAKGAVCSICGPRLCHATKREIWESHLEKNLCHGKGRPIPIPQQDGDAAWAAKWIKENPEPESEIEEESEDEIEEEPEQENEEDTDNSNNFSNNEDMDIVEDSDLSAMDEDDNAETDEDDDMNGSQEESEQYSDED